METNRLNQFYTFHQTKNMRKAAGLLGISHSGLSKSMSSLEIELGQKLYMQAGRGIIFTDEGEALAAKIPNFLKELENVTSSVKKEERKLIKIGTFEVFSTYFAKNISPLFDEHDLDFHELLPGKMEQALINHEIDIAITYDPIALSGVSHLKITQIEMGAYIQKGTFKATNLLDIPFAAPIIPSLFVPTGIKGLDGWPDDKYKRKIQFRVDLMETALSFARNGLCAIFIPNFIAKLHNQLVKDEFQLISKKLPDGMKEVKRNIYIVKRDSTVEDFIIKRIAKELRGLSHP